MAAPITVERLRELLDYHPETGVFRWKVSKSQGTAAGSAAGFVEREGYRRIKVDGRKYKAHRLAWLHVHGEWPSREIDHVNRNPDDNRIDNLRLATASQNRGNSRRLSNNTSGYKGVSFRPETGRWRARISHGGKSTCLGDFSSPEEASAAYLSAAKAFFGEFSHGGE